MSDTSTMQAPSTDRQEAAGHGRHRGQVSAHEADSAPHGRHRRPAETGSDDTAEAAA
jgi:hypothetical protein